MSKQADVYPEPGKRRCCTCRAVKPFAEFIVGTGRGSTGSECKPCKCQRARDRRAKDTITPERIARFWSRVKKGVPGPLETPCWIWQGAPRNHEGYGQFHFAGRNHAPHTIVLMLLRGIEGSRELFADHLCRVRMCCNPDHLRLVTPTQNALENNASPFAKNKKKTHCPRGHEYTPENTAVVHTKNPKGTSLTNGRMCLTCYPSYWRKAMVPREGRSA
jgi:hypothetical protein